MPISNPLMPDGLHVDDLTLSAVGLLITAHITAVQATCPSCGRSSTCVHSAYWRTLKDLPWHDRAVTWHLARAPLSLRPLPGGIFAEPAAGLTSRKARRSEPLAEVQTDIGMVLGDEPGARLSRRFAMLVSVDTVLRLIR